MNDTNQSEQFTKLEGLMTRLTEHVVSGFARVDERFQRLETLTATKEQMNAVYDLLDKNIGEHEKQEQERLAMNHQIDRLTRQVEQLARHIGVQLG